MSSLNAKDRVSLCRFTFADGRRCRSPRASMGTPRAGAPPSFSEGGSSGFCHYHAQKESRAATAEKLGQDLAYFFSADYVSANDLTTALARLIPAAVRGDIKPRTARTIAYMFQTLLQAIHLSQHEYINAFGTDGWRETIHNSVNSNKDYRFPPRPEAAHTPAEDRPEAPQPQPASSQPVCHPERSEGPLFDPAQAEAQSSTPLPTEPSAPPPTPTSPLRPSASSQPVCHPERSEGPLFDPAPPTNSGNHPALTTQPVRPHANPAAQTPQSANQPLPNPQGRPNPPTRDPYALHFDLNYRLCEPAKPF